MGTIIRDVITSSFGGGADDRALEHMGVMREELVNFEEPELYNSFARDLKGRMLSGELGGDRREMWWKVRKAKLGLIDGKESEVSKVTEDEAKEVGPLDTLLLRVAHLLTPAVLVLRFQVMLVFKDERGPTYSVTISIVVSHYCESHTQHACEILPSVHLIS